MEQNGRPFQLGDYVTFVDSEGHEHAARVTRIWSEGMFNLEYIAENGMPMSATSVSSFAEGKTGYYWK